MITVVIPTCNRKRLLDVTLASVKAQEGVTFEIVVVDDASTDGTSDALAEDPDIRLIALRERSERAAARNRGLADAGGDYVLFLDDDDCLAPDALRTLASVAVRRDVAAVVGNFAYLPGFVGPFRGIKPRRRKRVTWREVLLAWNPASPGQVLFRREAIEQLGGFDQSLAGVDDLDLLLRFARVHPLLLIPDVTLLYRHHPGQQKPQRSAEIGRDVAGGSPTP